MAKTLPPIHPGEILLHEFMEPLGVTRYRLSKDIGVPPQRIGDIVAGKRAITADTDLRLCRYFGLTDGYWLRGQARYDTQCARDVLREDLERIQPLAQKAA
ncbi:HigA family addiction module antitoxin [Luteimonas sp. MJ204]|uniref:HigA family addiction module antitoxin n=1 Tax=Luteimonas sp. MJ145 TaxID=3129234 RepID=UPI0031BBBC42